MIGLRELCGLPFVAALVRVCARARACVRACACACGGVRYHGLPFLARPGSGRCGVHPCSSGLLTTSAQLTSATALLSEAVSKGYVLRGDATTSETMIKMNIDVGMKHS